jgi:hypothetical protein
MPYFVNACDLPKNAAEQYCLFSRASFILCAIRCLFYCGVYLSLAELI